jgi:hypothetical protein
VVEVVSTFELLFAPRWLGGEEVIVVVGVVAVVAVVGVGVAVEVALAVAIVAVAVAVEVEVEVAVDIPGEEDLAELASVALLPESSCGNSCTSNTVMKL